MVNNKLLEMLSSSNDFFVCFSGLFTQQCTGYVTKLKLVSASGGVQCYPGAKIGYWGGCPHAPPINVWITKHRGDNLKYVKKSYPDI